MTHKPYRTVPDSMVTTSTRHTVILALMQVSDSFQHAGRCTPFFAYTNFALYAYCSTGGALLTQVQSDGGIKIYATAKRVHAHSCAVFLRAHDILVK